MNELQTEKEFMFNKRRYKSSNLGAKDFYWIMASLGEDKTMIGFESWGILECIVAENHVEAIKKFKAKSK